MNLLSPEQVPQFNSLEEFTAWYLQSGMPILLPEKQEVFLSDDATAMCLFRHGRYQFEMYLIHPNPIVPSHEHPGVENIEIPSSAWRMSLANVLSTKQIDGVPHGPTIRERAASSGFALYSAQCWADGIEINTIGARWKGYMAGPKHEALIRRFNPNCLIYSGYADVTKSMSEMLVGI